MVVADPSDPTTFMIDLRGEVDLERADGLGQATSRVRSQTTVPQSFSEEAEDARMVTVEDDGEVRFHRAHKAWSCAGIGAPRCLVQIAPGDRYAEFRRPGLSSRSIGPRYCASCAEALPTHPVERVAVTAVSSAAARQGSKPLAPATMALDDEHSGRQASSVTTADVGTRAGRILVLVAFWLVVLVACLAVLYGVMRGLDWLVGVMQQPNGPGGESY